MTWQLSVPETITLLPLSPYGPKLNPVERARLYRREHYLLHRLLNDHTAVLDATCRAWNALLDEPGRLASRAGYPYLLRSGLQ